MALDHKHLILKGSFNCHPSLKDVRWLLGTLVESLGMRFLSVPFVTYCDEPGNEGHTGFVLLTTSHIAYHDWKDPMKNEDTKFQLDVYSCSNFHPYNVVDILDSWKQLVTCEWKLFDRKYNLTEISSGVTGR